MLLAQVRSLYGPLLACVTASKSAFEAMVHQHSPQLGDRNFVELVRENPEGKEGQIYRRAHPSPPWVPWVLTAALKVSPQLA